MNDTTTTPNEFEPVSQPVETVAPVAPVAVKAKPKRKRKKAAKPRKKADPISASKASAPNTSDIVPNGVASIEEGAAGTPIPVAPLSLLREQMVPGRRHFGMRATATQVSMSVLPTGSERLLIAFAGSLCVAVVAIGTYAAWYWW